MEQGQQPNTRALTPIPSFDLFKKKRQKCIIKGKNIINHIKNKRIPEYKVNKIINKKKINKDKKNNKKYNMTNLIFREKVFEKLNYVKIVNDLDDTKL